MDKPIFVVGVNHSGTSMVAGILLKLGFDMGNLASEENRSRKDTYRIYEDIDLTKINNWFIATKLKRHWTNVWVDDWKILDNKVSEERIKKYIEHRQKNTKGRWGAKDPRIACLFPLWAKYLGDVKFIILKRDAHRIAGSIMRWSVSPYNRDRYVDMAKRYTNIIDKVIKEYPDKCLVINYESTQNSNKDREKTLRKICDFVGVGLPGGVQKIDLIKAMTRKKDYNENTIY